MLFELDWRHAEFQFGAVPVEEVLSGVEGGRSSGELHSNYFVPFLKQLGA